MATYTDPTIVQTSRKTKTPAAAYLFLGAGIVALIGAGWIWFRTDMAARAEASINREIRQQETRLAALQPVADELVALDQAAKNLNLLYGSQKQWDDVLGTIEGRLYKNMIVSNLDASDAGSFSFTAVTPSYTDYAKIYRSLTDTNGQAYFSSARPGNIDPVYDDAGQRIGIRFSFTLRLQPAVLNTDAVLALSDLINETAGR